eukprot:TRINITY_DN36312_c0_g1_i1.p1 TRINITY_DN36312_c0_g1~~TRINITY_DN36312_c0_g1_i1.p1  ORF type:complete len:350 (-),score=68.28 TRINITY_DN36312_c0_g1_i1:289-1338(-)
MAVAKLFVGCLPYSKSEADLWPVFEQFGPVQEVAIMKKPDGSSKGAAFVTYLNPNSALAALSQMQNFVFPGSDRGINLSIAGAGKGGGGGGKPVRNSGKGVMQGSPPPRGLPQQQPWGQLPQPAGLPQYMQSTVPPVAAPGTKVFVGQLPYSKGESDLWKLFGAIGPVSEVVLLKNQKTQEKKGAALVRFHNANSAAAAVAALDGFLFSNSPRAITVSIAQSDGTGQQKRSLPSVAQATIHSMGTQAPGALNVGGPGEEGAKLFVGQLPFSKSEEEIKQVFSPYGEVLEVFLHRDAQGQKKGGCFVRFAKRAQAEAALQINGFLFQGATRPIIVELAGTKNATKRQRIE